MRWTILTAIGTVSLVVLLSSCGLPSVLGVLSAPVLPGGGFTASSTNYFQFINSPQTVNAQSYGFELFYKLYDSSTVVGPGTYSNDIQTMNSAFSSTTPPSNVTSYLENTLGYNRVVSSIVSGYTPLYGHDLSQSEYSTLQSIPLVAIDPTDMGTSFTITIDFRAANNGSSSPPHDIFPVVSFTPAGSTTATQVLSIARLLPDPINSGYYFLLGFGSGDFYVGDPDLPSTLSTATGPIVNLQIGMVAVAYADDVLTNSVYYSLPVALTAMTYTSVTLQSLPRQ